MRILLAACVLGGLATAGLTWSHGEYAVILGVPIGASLATFLAAVGVRMRAAHKQRTHKRATLETLHRTWPEVEV